MDDANRHIRKMSDYKNLKYNRAKLSDYNRTEYKALVESMKPEGTCVFISHKSSDKGDAIAIAKYLDDCGVSTYIDLRDDGLQDAARRNDAQAIVKHIQQGPEVSTDILVLLSDTTKESWWVPYEIGYAKHAGKRIASLRLRKTNEDFPEYLKIETMLDTVYDVESYVKGLEAVMLESKGGIPYVQNSSSLRQYIRY